MAERALRDASVAAPFDGLRGAALRVSVGEFVQPGEALFELVALDPIEVEFHLAEVDSARVALGPAGRRARGAVSRTRSSRRPCTWCRRAIDPRTRTLRVKALLANADGRLRPGLFARADLGVAEREGVLMVPEEAVLQRSDGAVVFVRARGRPRRAPR